LARDLLFKTLFAEAIKTGHHLFINGELHPFKQQDTVFEVACPRARSWINTCIFHRAYKKLAMTGPVKCVIHLFYVIRQAIFSLFVFLL